MKPKMMNNIKELSATTNFNRIYTPQNYMRRDKKIGNMLKNNTSNSNTMVPSDHDYKKSVEPLNISTNKESKMTMKSSSAKNKHKLRVYSAHPNCFNRLQSANKDKLRGDMNDSKFTSLSAKDWKIFSVREDNKAVTESCPLRN